ncbi:MAG: C-terminal binding protein [Candidatus Sumerlaeia bacterium]
MSSKPLFKITDYIEPDLKFEEEECRKLGIDFQHAQLRNAGPAELINYCKDADIILVNMALFSPEVIAGLSNTKVVLRHGIGYDKVNVPAMTEHGIVFANEATASAVDVAEQAIQLMFATYKKLKIQMNIMQEALGASIWSYKKLLPAYRIEGKTLGIVGCGNIGSHVARKLKSFGLTIKVCDPYLSEERVAELGVERLPFEQLLAEADIVTIHTPLNTETRHMFNYDTIKLMKKTAILVNTARGPIVSNEGLAKALREGLIAGAGLDVSEDEPPQPGNPLIGLENVLMTPHAAWYSEEGGWDIRYMIMDDVKAFLEGRAPKYVVNKEVLDRPNLRFKSAAVKK